MKNYPFCFDCKIKLRNYKSIRCNPCSTLFKNKNKRQLKECLECKKTYLVSNSKLKKERGKYCSRKCFHPPHFIPCKNCKNPFQIEPKMIGKKFYCSRRCYRDFYKPPIKYCEICKELIKFRGNITYFTKYLRFCSPKCRSKGNARAWAGKPVSGFGEDHWNWQGGKGTERHTLMQRIEYKTWRKAIFERDNYTCKICHIKGGRLNADHIKSWAKYPYLRYDINNGRTLCYKCHYEITFGRQISPNYKWG